MQEAKKTTVKFVKTRKEPPIMLDLVELIQTYAVAALCADLARPHPRLAALRAASTPPLHRVERGAGGEVECEQHQHDAIGIAAEKFESLHPYNPRDGREDISAGDNMARVLRGGAFSDNGGVVRCAYRFRSYPSFVSRLVGFRVWAPNGLRL